MNKLDMKEVRYIFDEGMFMFASFWKIMPVLTLSLGAGLDAKNEMQKKNKEPVHQPACGLHEGECCYARSCKCAMGGALEFDFLYWYAENPGFSAYAYEQKNPYMILATIPQADIGCIVRLDAKWDPGFRIGAGWNTDFDRWDVFVNWTWYKNHSTESKSLNSLVAPSVVGFYPITFFDNEINPFQNTSSSWQMLHNAIDLELGRAYYITKTLSLRPHLGLRCGLINQKSRTQFYNPLTSEEVIIENYVNHAKNNYWGIGPRFGIHSQWHIASSSWSILAKASTSILLGETKAHFRDGYIDNAGNDLTHRDFKDHVTQYVPNLQIFLGVDWGSCLDCDNYYLGVNAGWETNIYWNQYNVPMANQYVEVAGLPSHSSEAVTMGGLTINFHFDY